MKQCPSIVQSLSENGRITEVELVVPHACEGGLQVMLEMSRLPNLRRLLYHFRRHHGDETSCAIAAGGNT
jgi:hypothetical protein